MLPHPNLFYVLIFSILWEGVFSSFVGHHSWAGFLPPFHLLFIVNLVSPMYTFSWRLHSNTYTEEGGPMTNKVVEFN